ncbi:MAG: hypothetical protein LBF93_04225, partial [Zoogloeaceae bacterium]|nr:hypothetical protein [Zoogloeaceae bacterium]
RHFAENLGRFGALQSIEPLFLASRSILSPLIAKVRQAARVIVARNPDEKCLAWRAKSGQSTYYKTAQF